MLLVVIMMIQMVAKGNSSCHHAGVAVISITVIRVL